MCDATATPNAEDCAIEAVDLKDHGQLRLRCDWGVGIGGGLWSTGLLLTQHLCAHTALYDGVFKDKRVLELGSGTGLVDEFLPDVTLHSSIVDASSNSLGRRRRHPNHAHYLQDRKLREMSVEKTIDHATVGFTRLAAARFGPPREVVITDLESHLAICRENVTRNTASPPIQACPIRVEGFDWGADLPARLGSVPFDIIVGTDVAYYEHLYAPFVQALERTAGPNTLVLLGVTRTDTGPAFFEALDKAGFEYNLVDQAAHKGFGLLTACKRQAD